jgi:hypothetical protein
MPGFKRFGNAAAANSGIDSMHLIRKEQFGLVKPNLENSLRPIIRAAVFRAQQAVVQESARTTIYF